MKTKICSRCKEELSVDFFNKRNSRKDGLQSECIGCKKEIQDNWYRNNNVEHYKNIKIHRNKAKQRLFDYLSDKKCEDCPENDPIVLEFNHLDPSIKEHEISWMASHGFAWDKMIIEINKCEILCCNCHRKKTAKQRGYYKYKMAS